MREIKERNHKMTVHVYHATTLFKPSMIMKMFITKGFKKSS